MSIVQNYWNTYDDRGQAKLLYFPAPAEQTQRYLDAATIARENAYLRAENTRLQGEVKDMKGWSIFGKFCAAGLIGSIIGLLLVYIGPWSLMCISIATLLGLTIDKWREERRKNA